MLWGIFLAITALVVLAFAASVAVHLPAVRTSRPVEDADVAAAALLAGGFGVLPGALLGGLAALLARGGRAGQAIAAVGLVFALAVGVALSLAIDPEGMFEVEWPFTTWLWEQYEWAGCLFWIVSIPMDLVVMVFAELFDQTLILAGGPCAGSCCGSGLLGLAALVLTIVERRSRPAAPPGSPPGPPPGSPPHRAGPPPGGGPFVR